MNDTHVVFVYYNPNETITTCQVSLDAFSVKPHPTFPDWDMIQLESGVSFFYHPFTLHPATRTGYMFNINGKYILDPRNPHRCYVGYASPTGYVSELAMPLFEREFYHIYRPEIPHGTLTTLTNYSITPKVRIYLPPNFNRSTVYPVVYFPDGYYYIDIMDTHIVLDNLLGDNLIVPLIAIFSDYVGDRNSYYTDKNSYFNHLDTLVAHIDGNYPTIATREGRLHVGLSLSGYISAIVGLERSDMFRNIAIQSMAFWPEDIPTTYTDVDPSLDLDFWMCCGTYELWGDDYNTSEDTERVVQFFLNKSWNVSLHLYPEGHIYPFWAHKLDELLFHFFNPSFIPPTTTTPSTITSEETTATTAFHSFLPLLLVLITSSILRTRKKHDLSSK